MPSSATSDLHPIDDETLLFHNGCSPSRAVLPGVREGKHGACPAGRVIYIDPFAGDQYNLPADLILVTHEHYDHNKVSLIGKRNDGCRIIRAKDAVVGGEHKTSGRGEMFDKAEAEAFDAPDKLIVLPRETITIE